jgi:hypothetical protein
MENYMPKGKPWGKKEHRNYFNLRSWLRLMSAWGAGLFWITLTSSPRSTRDKLARHHQELRRRAERVFNCHIQDFITETTEGYGVLHIVWAVWGYAGQGIEYIPKKWLKAEWLKIHRAFEMDIQKMGVGRDDIDRVAQYMVCQYMMNQSQLKRVYWAWWRCKIPIVQTWAYLRRCHAPYEDYYGYWPFREGEGEKLVFKKVLMNGRYFLNHGIDRRDLLKTWQELLDKWWGFIDGGGDYGVLSTLLNR